MNQLTKLLKTRNVKLRAGSKVILDMKTFKLSALPTIEVKVPGRKWLPLQISGRWYFETAARRDSQLELLQRISASERGAK